MYMSSKFRDFSSRRGTLRRLANFNRCVARAGEVVRWIDNAGELFQAFCTMAVELGHARLAWIELIDAGQLTLAASAGDMHECPQRWDLRPLPNRQDAMVDPFNPTTASLLDGQAHFCDEFKGVESTAVGRGYAACALPIRRDDRVIGVFTLCFAEANVFDPLLIQLLERFSSDLCFALEHIHRGRERAEAQQAANEHAMQLAGIVETAMDAIITVDAQFKIVVFNQAASHLFRLSPEQALGSPIDRLIPAENREVHRHHMRMYASEGSTSRAMGSGGRRLAGLRADGEIFPMEASISRSGQGDRLLMTVMARDVTQLRQAEKAILDRTMAEASNRAKTEFLSRVSHELRTPLNAVLGFTQLMLEDRKNPLSEHHHQQMALVRQAGEHLLMLIDDLLDIVRIESGKVHIEPFEVDLPELLDTVMRLCAPQALINGVHLETRPPSHLGVTLKSDAVRLRQVVLNLVSNGIKYNRPGGHVQVGIDGDDEHVEIVVVDDGLGMSPEQRAALFQPFNRLGREHSAVQGTGLGLVLVRELVRLLGGQLSIESELGRGTRVTVRLPRFQPDKRPETPPPSGRSN